MAALWKRYERLIRFVLVGGGVTVLYSGITLVLTVGHIAESRVWASAIASLIVIPLSFLAHRRVTYKDTAHTYGQFLRFGVIAAVNFSVNIGLMLSSELLGLSIWAALVIGWILVPSINFTINTIWVFRAKRFLGLRS